MATPTDSPVLDVSSSASEREASSDVILVTVHGTGAGDVTAAGDRWWQLGSAFLNELGKRLELDPSRVEISPFQWEMGPNSEAERRHAGAQLLEKMLSYDESGSDYYLIGHSHGGSVIYSALLQSIALGTPLERLRYWCTVGTPFLDYRPNRFLFQRLRSLGLTLFATGIVAFILGAWILLMLHMKSDSSQILTSMGHSLMFYGVINFLALWVYERFKKTWYTRAQKKKTEKLYSSRWLGLWHLEDEAISALSNIKKFSVPVIPSTFLQPLVATTQLLLAIAPGIYLAHDMAIHDGALLEHLAHDLLKEFEKPGTADLTWMTGWMIVVFCIPIIWILTVLLNILAKILGKPLAWVLNGIIWSSVRKRAWGDDLLKEDVREIGSHPPEFAQTFASLPDAIMDPLRKHSDKHALKTLQKVRKVLGMTQDSTTAPDLRSDLSEQLTWEELIHTSYFDVPEFVDLVALSLHGAGLAELKEEFSLTAERKQLADWCNGSSSTNIAAVAQ